VLFQKLVYRSALCTRDLLARVAGGRKSGEPYSFELQNLRTIPT